MKGSTNKFYDNFYVFPSEQVCSSELHDAQVWGRAGQTTALCMHRGGVGITCTPTVLSSPEQPHGFSRVAALWAWVGRLRPGHVRICSADTAADEFHRQLLVPAWLGWNHYNELAHYRVSWSLEFLNIVILPEISQALLLLIPLEQPSIPLSFHCPYFFPSQTREVIQLLSGRRLCKTDWQILNSRPSLTFHTRDLFFCPRNRLQTLVKSPGASLKQEKWEDFWDPKEETPLKKITGALTEQNSVLTSSWSWMLMIFKDIRRISTNKNHRSIELENSTWPGQFIFIQNVMWW